jgi:putative copper export protein
MVALFLFMLAAGCWLGGMIFFAFCAAPVIFSRLPIAEAGRVVAGIFPLYYGLAYIAGPLSIATAFYLAMTRAARGWWFATCIMLAVALGLMIYAGAVVGPRVDAVRSVVEETNPDPARKATFDALHRLSVELSAGAMVLEVLALLSAAAALI